MATVIFIIKMMPSSPNVDLKQMQEDAEKSVKKLGAQNISFELEEIAFGLKAVKIKLDLDESKGSEIVESTLSRIENVSSVTIEDYRRAFG